MSRAIDQAAASIAEALETFVNNSREDICADDVCGLEDTIENFVDNKLSDLDIERMVEKEVSNQMSNLDASDFDLKDDIQKHLESPAFQEVLDRLVLKSLTRVSATLLHLLYAPMVSPPVAEPVNPTN